MTKAYGRCSRETNIIKIFASTVYKWYLNCGEGTNMKVELLGVWETLYIANYLSISKLQVLGDSKVILNLLNNKGNICVSSLEGWKQRISLMKEKFMAINFYHIFREYKR